MNSTDSRWPIPVRRAISLPEIAQPAALPPIPAPPGAAPAPFPAMPPAGWNVAQPGDQSRSWASGARKRWFRR